MVFVTKRDSLGFQANHILDGQRAISGMAIRANDGIHALLNILPKSNVEERKLNRLMWMNSRITMDGSLRLKSRIAADHLSMALALLRPRRRCVTIIIRMKSLRHPSFLSITVDAVRMMHQHEVPCPIRLLPPLSISSSKIMITPHPIPEGVEGTTRVTLKTFNNVSDRLHPPSNRSAPVARILVPHQL